MPDTSAVRSLLTDVMSCDSSLAVGDAVYVSASDTVAKADASVVGTADVLGFIIQKPTATTCIVQVAGECNIFTSLTPDTIYYLSDTAGGIQSTPGTVSVKIGLALDATTILLVPGGSGLGGVSSPFTAGSGTNSAVLSGEGNTALAQATFAGGQTSSAQSLGAWAWGSSAQAIGLWSHAEAQGSAQASYCHAEGSSTCLSSSTYGHSEGKGSYSEGVAAHAGGERAWAKNHGQFSRSSGSFTGTGPLTDISQYSEICMKAVTTTATPVEMSAGSSQLTVPLEHVLWGFIVHIVAVRDFAGGGDCASFVRRGLLQNKNDTTSLIGSIQTIGTDIGSNGGSPPAGWAVDITADNTNKALKITVTGAGGMNVRWTAKVELTEAAYP